MASSTTRAVASWSSAWLPWQSCGRLDDDFDRVPALLGGVAGIFLLLAVVGHFASQSPTATTVNSPLVQHQVQGLANPLNSEDSTLDVHFSEMLSGFVSTVTDPLGHGTGAVTIASSRYGGTAQGTEVDPSNLGVALGIPGLLGYIVVAAVGLFTAYEVAARKRRWWTLAAPRAPSRHLLEWSNGGQYAVAWLPWLVLGWADRAQIDAETVTPNAPAIELPTSMV